ncbi:MAG: polysaccharide biosynthesis/export family protein [candidate division Zixibacteria bacterium]|nr:polysaccharide biosynthesis/export family protein [candidate division Zixibacteria bacterium]MDD5426498.1 polysaccharide biosynthesis/export family protein [candidate division Zixibacteria bacterium]
MKSNQYLSGKTIGLGLFIFLCGLISPFASEYKIGAEDVLEVIFWQDPQLNTTVRVSLDGKITLDIIGRIDAAGKTTEELQNDIVRNISRLNKNISQAVVRVTAFNYNHVFITGEVETPGKKTFEEIPDLWTIINESGGITEFADLSRVAIIRGGEQAGQVEIVNIRNAIATGNLKDLPKIRRQDTIEIPRRLYGLTSSELTQPVEKKNVIYVVGAVNQPGPVEFEENVDFMEILALAGGPTPEANLKKARILTKDGPYAQSYQINLEKYTETGRPARYILKNEDTFVIPQKSTSFFSGGITTWVALIGGVTSAVLLYELIKPDETEEGAVVGD